MSSAVALLPDRRLAELAGRYAAVTARRRVRFIAGLGIFAALMFAAAHVAEVRPALFFAKLGNFTSYLDRLATLDTGARVWSDPAEWLWGLGRWARLLLETMLMAYVGTVLGFLGAFCLCFLAAANLTRNPWLRGGARRFLEVCRTVPEIVFALVFVIAFGLGPLPGVLAIAIHTVGALGKLFSEVVENIDMKPVEGAVASGADFVQCVRFAVVPQVLSNFASYTLLRFESNVRGASVMGFVGAGGIGQDLIEAIRKFYYSDVSALLALIVATVFVIDFCTEKLRHRLIGMEARA